MKFDSKHRAIATVLNSAKDARGSVSEQTRFGAIRTFGEKLSEAVGEFGNRPRLKNGRETEKQQDYLGALYKLELLSKREYDDLDIVREIGNKGAHGEEIFPHSKKKALDAFERLAQTVEKATKQPPTPPPPLPPPPPPPPPPPVPPPPSPVRGRRFRWAVLGLVIIAIGWAMYAWVDSGLPGGFRVGDEVVVFADIPDAELWKSFASPSEDSEQGEQYGGPTHKWGPVVKGLDGRPWLNQFSQQSYLRLDMPYITVLGEAEKKYIFETVAHESADGCKILLDQNVIGFLYFRNANPRIKQYGLPVQIGEMVFRINGAPYKLDFTIDRGHYKIYDPRASFYIHQQLNDLHISVNTDHNLLSTSGKHKFVKSKSVMMVADKSNFQRMHVRVTCSE